MNNCAAEKFVIFKTPSHNEGVFCIPSIAVSFDSTSQPQFIYAVPVASEVNAAFATNADEIQRMIARFDEKTIPWSEIVT